MNVKRNEKEKKEKLLKMIIKILHAYLRLSSRIRISSEYLFVFVEHDAVLIFMDDAQVSTIKYGAIKQFHHYKIQIHSQIQMQLNITREIQQCDPYPIESNKKKKQCEKTNKNNNNNGKE